MLGTLGGLRYLGEVSALLLPASVNPGLSSSPVGGQVNTEVEGEGWCWRPCSPAVLQVCGSRRPCIVASSHWLYGLTCVPLKFPC